MSWAPGTAITHKITQFQSEHLIIVREPNEGFEEIITRFNASTTTQNLLFYL
jgi:hypothetical protein